MSIIDQKLSYDDVESLFHLVLRRDAGDSEYVNGIVDSSVSLGGYIAELISSDEFYSLIKNRLKLINGKGEFGCVSSPALYRTSTSLKIREVEIKKALILGSCLLDGLIGYLKQDVTEVGFDIYFIGTDLPEAPISPISDYDFQLVQLPLRSVLPDFAFARLSQTDFSGHKDLFDHSVLLMKRLIDSAMKWNKNTGLLTFFLPFPVPQQNMVGRLMPRYDLRNPVYFIEKLNETMYEIMSDYKQTYLLDTNEISSTLGKRFVYEDHVAALNHGSFINDFDFSHDQNRIEDVKPISQIYDNDITTFSNSIWQEAVSMYRSIKQMDSIKLVVIDLDDTLWRGIVAETNIDELPTREGWPLGFWESLMILKRRGVLLAIISKNEENLVKDVWTKILTSNSLQLEDFAITRINWRSKSENMAEILDSVNLLPGNVLFIDDNPAQREDIKLAFPGIRVMGGTPNIWRHILLWAPETQTVAITDEAAARTQMVRAQVEREKQRNSLSDDDFLKSLEIRQTFIQVDSDFHPRFQRIMELINKTNQFNTTGKRWTLEECIEAFAQGVVFYAFDLADRFTEYGLVGVIIVKGNELCQFVMSCRIMGLKAELNAISFVVEKIRQNMSVEIVAKILETDRNLPCRNVYASSGFVAHGNDWILGVESPPVKIDAYVQIDSN